VIKRKLLGIALIALPFIVIFILSSIQHGVVTMAIIFGVIAVLVAAIYKGAELLVEG